MKLYKLSVASLTAVVAAASLMLCASKGVSAQFAVHTATGRPAPGVDQDQPRIASSVSSSPPGVLEGSESLSSGGNMRVSMPPASNVNEYMQTAATILQLLEPLVNPQPTGRGGGGRRSVSMAPRRPGRNGVPMGRRPVGRGADVYGRSGINVDLLLGSGRVRSYQNVCCSECKTLTRGRGRDRGGVQLQDCLATCTRRGCGQSARQCNRAARGAYEAFCEDACGVTYLSVRGSQRVTSRVCEGICAAEVGDKCYGACEEYGCFVRPRVCMNQAPSYC
eukprot:GHVT01093069.1.p1 GENE.GHVT01093069.1~~GHVT01093069.1.p1  ORF type:complete len:278 (-),score=37.24 GHVT01093069.1:2529-3362(-)